MSHFSVAVFLPDDKHCVHDLLAPYSDDLEVAPYHNGDELTSYNPDSKWGGYQIGGQWQGELILKPKKNGIRTDTPSFKKKSKGYDGAFVRDIDFEAMRKRKIDKLEPYEKAMKNSFMKEEYMRERFPTEKEYIERKTLFSTYAVITPDGKWHAPGYMGWWGISSETPEEERIWELNYHDRFIKPAIENNWYMVIVDCHI